MQLTSLLKALAISTSLAVVPTLASAQAYPTRAIKIIVPAPPGGAIDTIARVVGDKLALSMGQPVVVDNRPGASNNLGTDVLAKSAPDGYTIGIVGGSHTPTSSCSRTWVGTRRKASNPSSTPTRCRWCSRSTRRFRPRPCPSSSPG